MLRKVITPDSQEISIKLPQSYIGRKVELIAFTIDEKSDDMVLSEAQALYRASEKTLAKDWMSPEEDKAWENL